MTVSTKDLPTLLKENNHHSILQYLRSHKQRHPELTIKHSLALLDNKTLLPKKNMILFSTMSDSEHLAILEQLCISACDMHDSQLASQCIDVIKSTFIPCNESTRVNRLIGMLYESNNEMDKANILYDSLLEKNPSNTFALKRKYCILRSQSNKDVEAREALNKYLELNQGDPAAWMEMYHTCMGLGDYKSAAFCLEESVLACPLDYKLHCMLAEVYVTIGSISNLKLARKHFAQSLELNPSNVRALFGLVSATSSYIDLVSEKKNKEEEDLEVAKELLKYGVDKIMPLYKDNSAMSKAVRDVMDQYRSMTK